MLSSFPSLPPNHIPDDNTTTIAKCSFFNWSPSSILECMIQRNQILQLRNILALFFFFKNVIVPLLHGMELSQIEQGLVPGIHVFFMP